MNIFIGNLSKHIDEYGIHRIFKPYGLLKEVRLGRDLGTGRTTGCATVQMFSAEEGLKAIELLNNMSFLGHRLMVSQRLRH